MDEIIIGIEGGCVMCVVNEKMEDLEYLLLDLDSWEGGQCPCCLNDGLDWKSTDEPYPGRGRTECPRCGANSDMNFKELYACWTKYLEEYDRTN
jgi:hypothetical protein